MPNRILPRPNATFQVRSTLRVIDGDTVEVEIDKYHGLFYRCRVRLLEVDTPEKRDREAWQAATDYTRKWVDTAVAHGYLYMEGHRMDSFGRVLGYLHNGHTLETLNTLIAQKELGTLVPLRVHLARFLD